MDLALLKKADRLQAGEAARAALRAEYREAVSVCPQCAGRMEEMGLDFRAPPQKDAEAWEIIGHLRERGFAFFGCGCGGPNHAPPPRRRRDLPDWLNRHVRRSEGEATLISKKWDDKLPGLRFVAQGGRYVVRTNMTVRGFHGWACYAGTLRAEPVEADELKLAEEARERTTFGKSSNRSDTSH